MYDWIVSIAQNLLANFIWVLGSIGVVIVLGLFRSWRRPGVPARELLRRMGHFESGAIVCGSFGKPVCVTVHGKEYCESTDETVRPLFLLAMEQLVRAGLAKSNGEVRHLTPEGELKALKLLQKMPWGRLQGEE